MHIVPIGFIILQATGQHSQPLHSIGSFIRCFAPCIAASGCFGITIIIARYHQACSRVELAQLSGYLGEITRIKRASNWPARGVMHGPSRGVALCNCYISNSTLRRFYAGYCLFFL